MRQVELEERVVVQGAAYGPGSVQMTDTHYATYAVQAGLVEATPIPKREHYVLPLMDVAQPEVTDESSERDAVDEAVLAIGDPAPAEPETPEAPADEPEPAESAPDAPEEAVEEDAEDEDEAEDEADEPDEDAAPV